MDGPSVTPRASWNAGLRAGIPFALAALLLSASFGVIALDAGFSALAAIVMSAIVFAGSAQFAAIAIVAAGGGLGAAVAAAALMNSRFLPMGIALAPSLPGGALKQAAEGRRRPNASRAGAADRRLLVGHGGPGRRALRPLVPLRGDGGAVRHLGR